jgi:hypothetical protein
MTEHMIVWMVQSKLCWYSVIGCYESFVDIVYLDAINGDLSRPDTHAYVNVIMELCGGDKQSGASWKWTL